MAKNTTTTKKEKKKRAKFGVYTREVNALATQSTCHFRWRLPVSECLFHFFLKVRKQLTMKNVYVSLSRSFSHFSPAKIAFWWAETGQKEYFKLWYHDVHFASLTCRLFVSAMEIVSKMACWLFGVLQAGWKLVLIYLNKQLELERKITFWHIEKQFEEITFLSNITLTWQIDWSQWEHHDNPILLFLCCCCLSFVTKEQNCL